VSAVVSNHVGDAATTKSVRFTLGLFYVCATQLTVRFTNSLSNNSACRAEWRYVGDTRPV